MSYRLVALEFRRSSMPLLLPALAALTYFSPARQHLADLAIWATRSADMQTALQGSGPALAGVAAWTGEREHRSRMEDLLKTTSRSWWTRVLSVWTATTLWGLVFYGAVLALLVAVTRLQGAWGEPVLWPVLVSVLTIPALSAVGFALGYHFPSRFTAPLVAISVFICFFAGISLVQLGHPIGYLVPIYPSIAPSDSVWYRDRPDLGIVQTLLLLGLTFGSLASLEMARRGRNSSRFNSLALLAGSAGVVLMTGSVFLINSSRVTDGIVHIPAFGGSGTNVALRYTPVCDRAPVQVCVHPAYQSELDETTGLINRIAAPLTGVPGAPTFAMQRPSEWGVVSYRGRRALLFAEIDLHDPSAPTEFRESWGDQLAVSLISDSLLSTTGWLVTDRAQNAMALYLLRQAGLHADPAEISVGAACQRLVGL